MDPIINQIEKLPFDIYNRTLILLVQSGVKPAALIDIYDNYWNNQVPEQHPFFEEREKNLEQIVKLLGIYCSKIDVDGFNTKNGLTIKRPCLYIGKNETSFNQLMVASSEFELGIALGYPLTAVEAVVEKKPALSYSFHNPVFKICCYRLSAENWVEEIKIAENWLITLRTKSIKLYQELLSPNS